jgi:hypothetical protein
LAGRVTEGTIPFPPGSSALPGTITRRDGTPVADTIVAVTGFGSSADHGAQKTDARGAFGFESLPAGLYRLSVGDPRYSSVSAWADLGENEAKNVQIEVGVPAMTGIVTEAASGAPVRGAQVSLRGRVVVRGSSDDRGEYRIEDVPPGPYRLVVSCEGYGFRSLGERQIGAEILREDIALPAACRLLIHVLGKDGEPYVGRVLVRLTPKQLEWTSFGATFFTDPRGCVSCPFWVPGTYDARLWVEGVGSAEALDVTLGTEAELTLRLQ